MTATISTRPHGGLGHAAITQTSGNVAIGGEIYNQCLAVITELQCEAARWTVVLHPQPPAKDSASAAARAPQKDRSPELRGDARWRRKRRCVV